MDLELPEAAAAALDVADLVPAGRVTTYGALGAVLGIGPRQAGRIMSEYGHLTSWWRVVRADGTLAPPLAARAAEHWAAEGTPLHTGTRADQTQRRVDMARALWIPSEG